MYLVQLLIPLHDNDGRAFPADLFLKLRDELVERFGGVTAYTRAPAAGLWQGADGERPVHDEIVVYEVMTDALDRAWWKTYRETLEQRFAQEALVVRVQEVGIL